MCDQFEYLSVIWGHHIYKDIFIPTIGKSWRELDNDYDGFAVAIIGNDTIVEPPTIPREDIIIKKINYQ